MPRAKRGGTFRSSCLTCRQWVVCGNGSSLQGFQHDSTRNANKRTGFGRFGGGASLGCGDGVGACIGWLCACGGGGLPFLYAPCVHCQPVSCAALGPAVTWRCVTGPRPQEIKIQSPKPKPSCPQMKGECTLYSRFSPLNELAVHNSPAPGLITRTNIPKSTRAARPSRFSPSVAAGRRA
jgi:hypothetical protein